MGDGFRYYRSVVRSVALLYAPCPPSWTSKILANMYIIATGGFLGRLEPCIRYHFDDIFMYATFCWCHFDVSDMILTPFFRFGHHFFVICMKMCSPPRQEAHFRKPIFANIVYKAKFPFQKWLQNHYFGGVISVLCCSKNSSFRRLSGKWPSWEALYTHQTCH